MALAMVYQLLIIINAIVFGIPILRCINIRYPAVDGSSTAF